MLNIMGKFWRDESGQAVTEFVILLAVAASFAIYLIRNFLDGFRGQLNGFATALQNELTVGSCTNYPDDCFRKVENWNTSGP